MRAKLGTPRSGAAGRPVIAPRHAGLIEHARDRGSQSGFTLIEVLVAIVVLVVGLLALLTTLDTAVKASMITRAREGATNLARELVEDARTIPYAQIIPSSVEGQLQAMKGLATETPGSGWQIKRRGIVYTIEAKECAIDDPKDGLATAETHEKTGTFCPGQENWKEGLTLDTEPEDLKRMTAKVSWTIQKRTSNVEQEYTLTAAGQAVGLTATKLELTSPKMIEPFTSTEPVITAEATPILEFSVAFEEGATAIIWSLEGAKQEERTVPSTKETTATFDWTINDAAQKIYVPDGTYQVSAQTVNSTGVIGPPISISVRLIRGVPKAPSEVVGGFDIAYTPAPVELQWKASSEKDVIGYRVYGPEPSKELICPASKETLSTATSCTDFKEPPEGTYTVVALYRNAANELAESPPGEVPIKLSESIAPSPPTNLMTPTKNLNGSVTLKWTAPTGGTSPAFYRIYRGSKEYSGRYGTTFSSECETGPTSTTCSFTDTEPGTGLEYWVTAVSHNLVESEFVGPVIG